MEKLISLHKSKEDFILLNTSKKVAYSEDKTILLSGKKTELISQKYSDFKRYQNKIKENFLAGYFSYDLKNSFEKLPEDEDFFIRVPNIHFVEFENQEYLAEKLPIQDRNNFNFPEISFLKSNLNKNEYLDKVKKIKAQIVEGNIYQANLTRKFYGEFKTKPNTLDLYLKLNDISPAPYSAFAKLGDIVIISSSPELFLKIDSSGKAITCPIKGSANSGEAENLSSSGKDLAENLMITDLMRNDFSRSCTPGSVKVKELFNTYNFATVSHMISTVEGNLKKHEDGISLIQNCFPPGSMTGTPKIKAMEIISDLEKHKRGIYSGALGYFKPNGSINFSVVIRSIIIQGNKFEFQVGGGIVHDSEPEKEWQETMIKADAIAQTLNIKEEIFQI